MEVSPAGPAKVNMIFNNDALQNPPIQFLKTGLNPQLYRE